MNVLVVIRRADKIVYSTFCLYAALQYKVLDTFISLHEYTVTICLLIQNIRSLFIN